MLAGMLAGDELTLQSAFGTATGVADVTDDVAHGMLFMTLSFSGERRQPPDVRRARSPRRLPEYKLTPVEITRVASAGTRPLAG